MFNFKSFSQIIALVFLIFFHDSSLASPNVVVTIKPIHSLVAAVLEGVAEPRLLLDGAASPHAYALKPTDAEALSKADAVIRVSETLEVFLLRIMRTLPANTRIIDLEKTPGLSLLPIRDPTLFMSDTVETGGGHGEDHGHAQGATDVHFWLDPVNAIAITKELARQFSDMDPAHAAQYQANAELLEANLAALDRELSAQLAGLSGRPFVVFHDVTQYLEKRYGLNSAGAITLGPEREPGARHLAAVRDRIRTARVICVLSEPQFPPKLVKTLTEGTAARLDVIDEIGAAIPAGPGLYSALLRADARHLASCLKS